MKNFVDLNKKIRVEGVDILLLLTQSVNTKWMSNPSLLSFLHISFTEGIAATKRT